MSSRILVVDDEKVIRDIMFDFLKGEGFDVTTVINGKEALNLLIKEHFDLVLADLKMPVMDGMELLREIQNRKFRIPTIVMTGFGTLESAVESMKRGAYDYIQKPFKMADVLAVVHRGIKQKKVEEENIQLKEIMNLYKVSEALTSSLSLPEILDIVIDNIMREIDADAVSLHYNEDNVWRVLARRSIEELESDDLDIYGIPRYDSILSYFEINPYLLIEGGGAGPFFEKLPKRPGLRSYMTVPMHVKSKVTGLACCYAYRPGHYFLEGHSRVLSVLSGRAASAIENAQLYQRLQQTLQETIQGLVTALEAKDRYTSGHTKRVTEYAMMAARGMNMDRFGIEQIRRASLLHDIGKIGIRLEALNKPEKLSGGEYEAFKDHPRQSRIILEPIQFLKDIIPIVEAHHERWDGAGYPHGLKGEGIPQGARILAVADSFDAMTSDRPYRRALSRQAAIKELRTNAGSQFDPGVVEVFIREIQKKG